MPATHENTAPIRRSVSQRSTDPVMHIQHLLDPASALIVLGGTLLATFLRSGWSDCAVAIGSLLRIGRPRFHAAQARAELAGHVRDMQRDGLIRAEPHHCGDAEFDEVSDSLVGTRSLSALHAAHRSHKRRRQELNHRAVRVLVQAAELAPVFGMAGTLIALSQLPAGGGRSDFSGAIAMAVVTTLYGLLLGNLVFAPLARLIERQGATEERERQQVVDWLERQLEPAVPQLHRIVPKAG